MTLSSPPRQVSNRFLSWQAASHGAPLPAWPLLTLFYGLPLIWLAGLMQFAPTILSVIMVILMIMRRRVLVHSVLWIWLALVFWALICVVSINSASEFLGWFQRYMNLFNVGVYCLYYFNARERVSARQMIGGLFVVWLTVVLLGFVAMALPNLRITTPMSLIMPGSLLNNELVRDYVMPPMAEVQKPWGAEEAYVRPSAPFPYANSWGVAYALLTPLVIGVLVSLKNRKAQLALAALLALSLLPAVATSNRGMFIGIGAAFAYVLFRLFLKGQWKPLGLGLAVIVAAVTFLIASGAVEKILGRQQYSDSTGGRASLYELTFEYTLRSPLVGYGTSRMADSVGVSMGTQGQIWALMFCFGFVGLGLFLAYLLSALVYSWPIATNSGLWIHSVVVAALAVVTFYSFDVIQLSTLMLSSIIMIRSRAYREGL